LFSTQAKTGDSTARGGKRLGRGRSKATTQWYFKSVSFSPDAITAAVDAGEWVDAVGMALSLGRTVTDAVCSVVGKVPLGVMEFVAAYLPAKLAWMIEALAEGVWHRKSLEDVCAAVS
jgi:hypothetical protein